MWASEQKDKFLSTILKLRPQIKASEAQLLLEYPAFVVLENTKVNLTAITDPKEFAIKHIIDSLIVLDRINIDSKSVIDVGTGAGMPGLIWAVVMKESEFILLDSLKKRITFLEKAIAHLELTNVKTVHHRAEDAAKAKKYREKFTVVTARAVAFLPVLLEFCLPFVEQGGHFVALKGPEIEKEINESKKALDILGGEIVNVFRYDLPEEMGDRSLAIVKKVAKTPLAYPRRAGTPSKKPL